MKKIIKIVIGIMLVLIICCAIFFSLFKIYVVNGSSMEPTLKDGEFKLVHKVYDLDRFDIIVFNFNNTKYVKRVIGLPGETIEYIDNKLYINGTEIEDTYNNGIIEDFRYTIKDDEFICLGDNRDKSKDSRYFGTFKTSYIIGEIKE